MQTQHAFSLFELIIVIFIMAILAAMAMPLTKNVFERAQDDVLRSQILRTIQFAQEESRARRMPIALCKSKNHISCTGKWMDGLLVFINEEEDGVVKSREDILSIVQLGETQGTLYARSFPIYRNYLLFLPREEIHNDNGTFWYCRMKKPLPAWAIMLSQSGKARVVYPNKHGEIKDSKGKLLRCVDNTIKQ